ncbi:MAG: NADH-quinone oxidoreductase subunit NuoE [Candidatus Ozemobacteraceae bacterium]
MNQACKCTALTSPGAQSTQGLDEIFARYKPNKREYLIPILQETQAKFSFLSRSAMLEVAKFVGVPVSKVYGVATFYNQFKLEAPGKHIIQVCRGTACHVRGSDQILKAFESELKVKAGQTTKDKEFTLEIVACLGSCSIAPVITVDGIFHGRLAPKDVPLIMKDLREKAGTTVTESITQEGAA